MNPIVLLGLLPKLIKIVGKVTGNDKITEAGDALAGTALTPEQNVQLQIALSEHAVELAKVGADELKALISEAIAATQSEDPWVRRARPMGLYCAYLVTMVLVGAMIFEVKLDTGAIATLIVPLFGNAAWYTHNRTKEKIAG